MMDNTENLNGNVHKADSPSEDIPMESEPSALDVADSSYCDTPADSESSSDDENSPDSTTAAVTPSALAVADSVFPPDTPEIVKYLHYFVGNIEDMSEDSNDTDMFNVPNSFNNYDTPYPKNISTSSMSLAPAEVSSPVDEQHDQSVESVLQYSIDFTGQNFINQTTGAAYIAEQGGGLPFYSLNDHFGSRQGLIKSEINRIPTKTFLEDSASVLEQVHEEKQEETGANCGICYVNYENGDKIRTLPCSHIFHKNCLDPWLKIRGLCPLCRKPVLETNGDSFKEENE